MGAGTWLEPAAWEGVARVLLLRDYNTRVVVAGTMLFGVAAGMVGTFLLLRRRALLSDAISHATLPGIALAFLVATAMGRDARSLPWLLAGAAAFGTLGMLAVAWIRGGSRLKDDAALGVVLSVFYAAGIALLGLVQRVETANAAGLSSFIYGKTASMLLADARLIALVAAGVALACAAFFKEFALLAFDEDFGATQGYPTRSLDLALMALAVVVTVVGLQAVGLILVVAMLIVPAAAARFWSHDLRLVFGVSAAIGGASGLVGSLLSALFAGLPSGAIIVLVAATIFVVSLLFGTAGGLVVRALARRRLGARVARQHLLRSMFELAEAKRDDGWERPAAHTEGELLAHRAWSVRRLRREVRRATRSGLVRPDAAGRLELTAEGAIVARQLTTNHRLWELYLITHADIAPSHVDRDADMIEHVLDEPLLEMLRARLEASGAAPAVAAAAVVPSSPHPIADLAPTATGAGAPAPTAPAHAAPPRDEEAPR